MNYLIRTILFIVKFSLFIIRFALPLFRPIKYKLNSIGHIVRKCESLLKS